MDKTNHTYMHELIQAAKPWPHPVASKLAKIAGAPHELQSELLLAEIEMLSMAKVYRDVIERLDAWLRKQQEDAQ